jgi:hypothetical protein
VLVLLYFPEEVFELELGHEVAADELPLAEVSDILCVGRVVVAEAGVDLMKPFRPKFTDETYILAIFKFITMTINGFKII